MKSLEETILDLRQLQEIVQNIKKDIEVLELNLTAVLDELDGYAIKE